MATADATIVLHAELVAAVGRASYLFRSVSETENPDNDGPKDSRLCVWRDINFAKMEHAAELALHAIHISTVGSWRACALRSRDPGEGLAGAARVLQQETVAAESSPRHSLPPESTAR